jgi:hypothetical protein
MPVSRSLRLFAILLGLLGFGCGPGYIAESQVPATPENVAIYDVLERYRQAMESRDPEALRSIVSKRYYEHAATTDTDKDDYGIDILESKVLPKLRNNVKKLQYQVRLRSIAIEGGDATVDYEFWARALITESGVDRYIYKNDYNRLKLAREGGKWLIAAGL